jgi:hypothetical protein
MPSSKIALTAFLSHKYKAPAVNEYFFRLLSKSARVEFEVDVGSAPTNVTRLERLVRDADGFVGIYPFDELNAPNPTENDLISAAKYFRLELDLAARARKPGVVFVDFRFRGIVAAPVPIKQVGFDVQEIVGGGKQPSSPRFVKAFKVFADHVAAARAYALVDETPSGQNNLVGVLLPPEAGGQGYNRHRIDSVLAVVRSGRYEPIELPWPPQVTPEWISKIRLFDWLVIDVGSVSAASGVVGFLHGEFKPSMRLLRVRESDANSASTVDDLPLYSGFAVGYQKDIVRWKNSDDLLDGLMKRMASLHAERRRISTLDEALVYFRRAALRKEAVFISYAGADQQQARSLIEGFRRRFQQVFDYRDGKSIRVGQPWIKEIFDQLAVSPIGVPLLSSAYVGSGNCMHELREMVARRDSNQMQIFPIKLSRGDSFTFPTFLGDTQYAHLSNYATADKLIDWIVANIR